MARSTILTEKQIKDYHTSLVLTRILNLGDIFYYHYQPIKSLNPSSSIRLVLSNLDLQVIDHKNKPLKFKEHFDNLSWKVDYNNSTIQVFSKLNEIRNFAQFYAIDAAKNKYYFKIQNQDDEKIILKADDNSPLDKENELENCLYSDVNESTMYFTYN
jgi:hypothetical protein